MNNKLAAFFSSYGMTLEKNSAHGVVNGYETSAVMRTLNYADPSPLKIHISFYATDEQKRNIEAAFRNVSIKFFNFEITAYGVIIGLGYMTLNGLLKNLPAYLDGFYGILTSNGALGSEYCPVCGEKIDTEHVKTCKINELAVTLD